jgi:hypothetical protein
VHGMGFLSGGRLIILKLDLLHSTEKATYLREATNPMRGGLPFSRVFLLLITSDALTGLLGWPLLQQSRVALQQEVCCCLVLLPWRMTMINDWLQFTFSNSNRHNLGGKRRPKRGEQTTICFKLQTVFRLFILKPLQTKKLQIVLQTFLQT